MASTMRVRRSSKNTDDVLYFNFKIRNPLTLVACQTCGCTARSAEAIMKHISQAHSDVPTAISAAASSEAFVRKGYAPCSKERLASVPELVTHDACDAGDDVCEAEDDSGALAGSGRC